MLTECLFYGWFVRKISTLFYKIAAMDSTKILICRKIYVGKMLLSSPHRTVKPENAHASINKSNRNNLRALTIFKIICTKLIVAAIPQNSVNIDFTRCSIASPLL